MALRVRQLVPPKTLRHQCQRCGREFAHGFTPRCTACGGMVEIHYDLTTTRLHDADNSTERFFDLLPLHDPEQLLDLGQGGTPCVHAERLGADLGLERLFLKVESHNPTGTTKDRMAAVVLSMFWQLGIDEFVTCSTGNSSSSLAYGVGLHPYFRMHLYVGEAFQERVRHADDNPGIEIHVMRGLAFTETFNHARDEARRLGLPFEAGFFNPARREGLKLAYCEAVEQIDGPIHWYIQAASSAMGHHGTWKGARELHALGCIAILPRIVCVQQETCCPMVKAWEEGSPVIREHHIFPNPTGIARAILRGNPSGCYPYVYEMVRASNGLMVRVSESEIREGKAQVEEREGVPCGYSAATTVAAVAQLVRRGVVHPRETILLNLTD
jgi:threonine synthase